jgi:hypothetical protein
MLYSADFADICKECIGNLGKIDNKKIAIPIE